MHHIYEFSASVLSLRFRMYRLCWLLALALYPVWSPLQAHAQTVPLDYFVETVHSKPAQKGVGFAFLPDERILVIEHETGKVRLLVDGVGKVDPILTVPNVKGGGEEGLLGIAVDPDFPDSNYVYLYYTSNSGVNRVSKFRMNGALDDPASKNLSAEVASEQVLLELHNESRFHNAGTLRFGSDKTLYISHGDDVNHPPEDPNYLQSLTNPYGKILRINRDGSVPDDNPDFSDEPELELPEAFAIGLRNPFRFAIDPHTDRLFIGDVGSTNEEEYNLSVGGENFGYPRYEGDFTFKPDAPLVGPEPTFPIKRYKHGGTHRSAIALVTYRPKNYPHDGSFPDSLNGTHFYTDYYSDHVRYLVQEDGLEWESKPFGDGFRNLTDAAIGPDGSIYVLSYDGPLRRIYYSAPNVGVEEPPIAQAFELRPNYPNPFTVSTTITYRLERPGPVQLEVFDMLGRRVQILAEGWRDAGLQAERVSGAALAPGTYVYRLKAGGRTETAKMVRLGD